QPVEVREQRAPALREGVEAGEVDAQLAQPVRDHAVVLGLVAGLAGEGHLDLHVVGRDEPARRDLGGLGLVAERDLQEVGHGEVALHLGPQRRVGGQAAEEVLVGRVQLADELFGGHGAASLARPGSASGSRTRPLARMPPSSWVSVSFVTTRSQRAWWGWVSRASAWVVKPSTGGRGRRASRTARTPSGSPAVRSTMARAAGASSSAALSSSGERAITTGRPARRAVSRMWALQKRSRTTATARGAGRSVILLGQVARRNDAPGMDRR